MWALGHVGGPVPVGNLGVSIRVLAEVVRIRCRGDFYYHSEGREICVFQVSLFLFLFYLTHTLCYWVSTAARAGPRAKQSAGLTHPAASRALRG